MTTLTQKNEYLYEGDGMTMKREFGKTPNDNPMYGRWVLRDSDGNMLDFHAYRNDLAEQFDIKLISEID